MYAMTEKSMELNEVTLSPSNVYNAAIDRATNFCIEL